jgi:hypothetical protein
MGLSGQQGVRSATRPSVGAAIVRLVVVTRYQSASVLVNLMLHIARRAKALGLHYEARLRGLELCAINLTSTQSARFGPFAVCVPGTLVIFRGGDLSCICCTALKRTTITGSC